MNIRILHLRRMTLTQDVQISIEFEINMVLHLIFKKNLKKLILNYCVIKEKKGVMSISTRTSHAII